MRRTVRSLLLVSSLLAGSVSTGHAASPAAGSVDGLAGPAGSAASTSTLVLSGDFGMGISLALDSAGHRHLVAANQRGQLWYATDRTGSWVTDRLLTGRPGWWGWAWPSVATDAAGRVHIAVVKWEWTTPGGTAGIWYLTDADRSRGDFSTPARITPRQMLSPSLRIVDDVVYLAYAKCECIPYQPSAPVFFQTDRGGGWHRERIADRGYDPSLRVDAAGHARIAFSDRHALRYTQAATRLGDFGPARRIAGTTGLEGAPSLALDAAERERIVWSAEKQGRPVYSITRTTTGWSAPSKLGNGTLAEVSIDASDRPHVVLAWGKVIHRWLSSGTWQTSTLAIDASPTDVAIRAFGSGASIAWASDAVPRGVWFIRD